MPDQVAILDEEERVLFVGDTAYRKAPILFPERGSFSQYRETISKLKGMVQKWNKQSDEMHELATRILATMTVLQVLTISLNE